VPPLGGFRDVGCGKVLPGLTRAAVTGGREMARMARRGGGDPPAKGSRSARTRARILDAAEEVFGDVGFHRASIVEITRRAGVGLGTFYLHFPSKAAIFRALLATRQREFIAAARAAAAGVSDQVAVVRREFRALFDWMAERPRMLRLLREAEFVDPKIIVDLYRTPARAYRRRLERAMDLGLIEPVDAEVLAWCLMGMTEFAVLRWITWRRSRPGLDGAPFDAFCEVVLRALGARSGGRRPARRPAPRPGRRSGGVTRRRPAGGARA
jgi:AcrR family transcriptional regulator